MSNRQTQLRLLLGMVPMRLPLAPELPGLRRLHPPRPPPMEPRRHGPNLSMANQTRQGAQQPIWRHLPEQTMRPEQRNASSDSLRYRSHLPVLRAIGREMGRLSLHTLMSRPKTELKITGQSMLPHLADQEHLDQQRHQLGPERGVEVWRAESASDLGGIGVMIETDVAPDATDLGIRTRREIRQGLRRHLSEDQSTTIRPTGNDRKTCSKPARTTLLPMIETEGGLREAHVHTKRRRSEKRGRQGREGRRRMRRVRNVRGMTT
jgi:hypothetical protein